MQDWRYWDGLVHEDSTVTRSQSLLMFILFIMKHKITKVASADLLDLVNLHLPNLFPRSNYFIEKYFSVSDRLDLIEKHHFCEQCEGYIGREPQQECAFCGCSLDSSKTNFFLVMPLKEQITKFLSTHGLPPEERSCDGTYSSIVDGEAYQDLVNSGKIGPNDITCQWNCDGMPVFKSSNYSIWPIQIMINECAPSIRKKNIMLVALWFGSGKPRMDSFLTPFVETCEKLSKEGISWTDTDGNTICTKMHMLVCSSDAVARPALRHAKQFNGEFGCDWCLNPGVVVPKGDGHVRAYSADHYRERTHEMMVNDAMEASNSAKCPNGIKGLTPLYLLTMFNMVTGFVPDYLHSVCQGVMRQFSGLWLDSQNHRKPWYIGRQMKDLDRRLLKMQPPCEVTRYPRSLATRRFWKASEWRAFLLFYSLIILPGILPQPYLQHLFLLVFSIYTLLQSSVTSAELDAAERALRKFVSEVRTLYGLEYMSFNVHQLLHLPQSVRNWGPIWGISTFPFKGNGGRLLRMFSGTQHVSLQVCKSLILFQEAKSLTTQCLTNATDEINFFCEKLDGKKHHQSYVRICQRLIVIGKQIFRPLSLLEQIAVEFFLNSRFDNPCALFF